tara:strand:+ start:27503 stop:28360 length:858 start_codon:yes stop_codon:yes gene_type:complete
MTTILRVTIISLLTLTTNTIFTSCTDVIEVDVPEAETRLVVEASIDWEKGTPGNNQSIKLSTTTPYFDQETNTNVVGASVVLTNNNDSSETVFTGQNNGNYTTTTFIPVLSNSYTLKIIYNGETYSAQETLIPVTDIIDVYQTTEKGLKDVLEFNIDFQDPIDEVNYYYFKIQEHADLLPTLLELKDEFTDGNLLSVYNERTEDEDINQVEYMPGDMVNVQLYGISEQYSTFIRLLIEQYNIDANPFGLTPVPIKGNCINPSNPEKYALGYFRLTQVVKTNYTFQ